MSIMTMASHISSLPWLRASVLMGFLLVCFGCAVPVEQADSTLLDQDYRQMTNNQLIAYEQALSDELVERERQPSGDVSIGFAFGSWGGNGGYGLRSERQVEPVEASKDVQQLKRRRDAVRAEMRQRGLLEPLPAE